MKGEPSGIGGMAVTHDDLAVRERGGGQVAGERGLMIMVFCVLCGFTSFILCLAAEATRSEATWFLLAAGPDGRTSYRCYYGGSGRTPLLSAAAAFLVLAAGMIALHAHVLVATGGRRPPALVLRALSRDAPPTPAAKGLPWRACFFFVSTWVCFAIAEVILMVGISAESSHLTGWRKTRANCPVARQGLYAAAAVFGLATVFLAAGLYLTALRAERLHDGDGGEHARRRQATPGFPTRGGLHGRTPQTQPPESEDPRNRPASGEAAVDKSAAPPPA